MATQPAARIRTATQDDLAGVRHVAHVTWRKTYRGHIPDADIEAFLQSNYSVERLQQTGANLGDGFIVAALEDSVVGYATVAKNRDGDAELFTIYVLPEHQRVGLGALLWAAAIERAREMGVSTLVVWVLAENAGACAFYESRGATVMGHRAYPVGEGSIDETGYRIEIE